MNETASGWQCPDSLHVGRRRSRRSRAFPFASERASQVATSTGRAKSAPRATTSRSGRRPRPPAARSGTKRIVRKRPDPFAPDVGPRRPERFGLSQPAAAGPVRRRLRRRQRRRARIRGRAAGHGRRRRPEPLHPVHQRHRHDLRQVRQRRPRPVRRQRVLVRARRPVRGPERRRPARPVRPAGRPLGVSQFALPNFPAGPSTSASPSRRRTIRRATTGSTNSRRATTSSATTEARHLARRLLHDVQHVRPDSAVRAAPTRSTAPRCWPERPAA